MREVIHYERREQNLTACRLCPKLCSIREGKYGFCGVRQNRGGTLFATNYGKVSSCALDPIEKKPLYHFYPGSCILSFGSAGCNLRCGFCQNWSIAQGDPPTREVSPAEAVELARLQRERGYPNTGIAYTYNEPLMWYEYVLDTAVLAWEAGLKNVLVTNGYINETPLLELLPYIDAMNIDVKGFTDKYYRESCKGSLEPVLRTVEIARTRCHVELTTLLVTGLNDSEEEISRLVEWVASLTRRYPCISPAISRTITWTSRPHPETLQKARRSPCPGWPTSISETPQLDAGDTICPRCGETLIVRMGYTTRAAGLERKKCRACGREIRLAGEVRES